MTQKETLGHLVSDVEVLKADLASLKEEFSAFVKPVEVSGTPVKAGNGVTNSDYFPTPSDYIETVDLVLNKNFDVSVEPQKDAPSFLFTITVPPKYSPVKTVEGPNGVRILPPDVRTKVISFAEGVNGVRLWAERVYETFDSDTKFRIIEDRPFAQRPI